MKKLEHIHTDKNHLNFKRNVLTYTLCIRVRRSSNRNVLFATITVPLVFKTDCKRKKFKSIGAEKAILM